MRLRHRHGRRRRTGLGLAITRKLVDAHGGSVELHSAPGEGTEFVLSFPKQRREQGASP